MKKGLTLIELAVVIGIVLLLVFGVLTGLSMSRQRREVKTTAEKLKSMILEARSRAMNPSDDAYGLKGYQIRITKDPPANGNYTVSIYEKFDPAPMSGNKVQEFIFPKSVSIVPVGANIDIHSVGGGSEESFYHFNFNAENASELGYAEFKNNVNENSFNVSDTSDEETFQLTILKVTGNVEIEKI